MEGARKYFSPTRLDRASELTSKQRCCSVPVIRMPAVAHLRRSAALPGLVALISRQGAEPVGAIGTQAFDRTATIVPRTHCAYNARCNRSILLRRLDGLETGTVGYEIPSRTASLFLTADSST